MKRLILATATLFAAGCNCGAPKNTATMTPPASNLTQNYESNRMSALVGPRGPDGPVGPQGVQGPMGQTGPEGYAQAGSRGAEGARGTTGEQGPTGARGIAGDLQVGARGAVGPTGQAGAQGDAGAIGARGASGEGSVGPTGPVGPTGRPGPTGDTGIKGPILVGPTGPAGRAGATGQQGETGQIGAQGSTTAGIRGGIGTSGAPGSQGPVGSVGPQGPTGMVASWTPYREFWFEANTTSIHPADAVKVSEIAAYLNDNPTLQLGIDSSLQATDMNRSTSDLAVRRGNAVRGALIGAGVSADRISAGSFESNELHRTGRVGVVFKTDPVLQAQISPNDSSGMIQRWTPYQEFWFEANTARIHPADAGKVTQIVTDLNRNPSLQIRIDGSVNANGADRDESDLAMRRSNAVLSALTKDGVSADRISVGTYEGTGLRREGRVEVLFRSDQLSQERIDMLTGPTGMVDRWTSYREFWFDADMASIHTADSGKVADIAAYLQKNPSMRVGIDSSVSPADASQGDLAERRNSTIRNALIAAGVPSSSIKSGTFGQAELRRDGRVGILVISDKFAARQ